MVTFPPPPVANRIYYCNHIYAVKIYILFLLHVVVNITFVVSIIVFVLFIIIIVVM